MLLALSIDAIAYFWWACEMCILSVYTIWGGQVQVGRPFECRFLFPRCVSQQWRLKCRLSEVSCGRLEQKKRWAKREGREGGHGLAGWKKVVKDEGGCVAVSKSLELERRRVQLSLWQGHSTEGFIVICNYVVFCGASVWCAPTLRLFLAREYWVGEQKEGGAWVTVNYFC